MLHLDMSVVAARDIVVFDPDLTGDWDAKLSHEVIRLLGKGGMSEVYEVENPRLGSRHALKLFTCARGG